MIQRIECINQDDSIMDGMSNGKYSSFTTTRVQYVVQGVCVYRLAVLGRRFFFFFIHRGVRILYGIAQCI